MKTYALVFVSVIMFATTALFGMQFAAPRAEEPSTLFRFDLPTQPDDDRPLGVAASAWIPLGDQCGIILERQADTDDVAARGQLTCKIGTTWRVVTLSHSAPSIIPAK